MVKVSGTGSSSAPRRTDKSKSNSGSVDKGEFHRALAGAIDTLSEAPALGAPSALGAIDALFLAQSVDEDGRNNSRHLLNYGEEILNNLEDLRHSLLMGSISESRLITLSQQIRTRREACSDPRLAALLDDIELRAEVEIAKLTRSGGSHR